MDKQPKEKMFTEVHGVEVIITSFNLCMRVVYPLNKHPSNAYLSS